MSVDCADLMIVVGATRATVTIEVHAGQRARPYSGWVEGTQKGVATGGWPINKDHGAAMARLDASSAVVSKDELAEGGQHGQDQIRHLQSLQQPDREA